MFILTVLINARFMSIQFTGWINKKNAIISKNMRLKVTFALKKAPYF